MPISVLQRIQAEMLDYRGSGMSVMEWSHRSKPIEELLERVHVKLRRLLRLPSTSDVVLLQGGGSLQFHMVPMNFSLPNDPVDYVDTGYWTRKAIAACQSMGRDVHIAAKSHTSIPSVLNVRSDAKYLHICTNNTVVGTQWKLAPEVALPIVADMSSDILSGPQDINRYDLVYAHAQKTIGTAGVTIVVLNERMRQSVVQGVPPFFDYRAHVAAGSNFHTPPVFAIYVVDCMLDWLEVEVGGLDRMGEINTEKARLLYDFIDGSTLFTSSVEKSARSQMNVVFDIEDIGVAKRFSDESHAEGFVGLEGHRTRGGYRASLYNAVTPEEVGTLVDFMRFFEQKA